MWTGSRGNWHCWIEAETAASDEPEDKSEGLLARLWQTGKAVQPGD